jgi:hypothetical protein
MNLILDKGDEYMDVPPAGWRVKFRDDATLILKRHGAMKRWSPRLLFELR